MTPNTRSILVVVTCPLQKSACNARMPLDLLRMHCVEDNIAKAG